MSGMSPHPYVIHIRHDTWVYDITASRGGKVRRIETCEEGCCGRLVLDTKQGEHVVDLVTSEVTLWH